MNLENEVKNFNGGGLELPDLTDKVHFEKFRKWDGNSHNIQHLDVKYVSKKYLNDMKSKTSVDVEMKE
jgi:translation machinery-associated protein 16